jgi:hypothetical protein
MRALEIGELEALEIIDPRPMEPWRKPVFDQVHIDHDKDKALEKVAHIMETLGKVIFTDASTKGSSLGAAAVMLDWTPTTNMASRDRVGLSLDRPFGRAHRHLLGSGDGPE